MSRTGKLTTQQRMAVTFDLFSLAEKMMRQNLRRRHPAASEPEVETMLLSWLRQGRPTGSTNEFLRPTTRPWQSH